MRLPFPPSILLLPLLACGGSEQPSEPAPPRIGSALHLLDRAAAGESLGRGTLDADLAALVDEAGIWILDEPIAAEDWKRDDPAGAPAPLARWLAKLRYPLALDRSLVPIDRLHIREERRQEGTGRTRAEREGEAALLKEGGISVLWPRAAGAPPALRIAYLASTSAVENDLASVAPGSKTFAPRPRILGEETRRSLAAPVPWSRTWDVEVPAGARLHFAWGWSSRRIRVADEGLYIESDASPRFGAQVVLARAGRPEEVLWRGEASAVEGDRFHGVLLDLGAHAGARVELRFELDAAGMDAAAATDESALTALLAEPVIDAPAPEGRQPPPSVLVLLIDTLRADRLGCYGWERAHTPNLDRLAERGVRFSRTTSAAPWTLPSIASLLSSLYVSEHGIWHSESLPDEVLTLAEVLRESSYLTAAFTEGAYAGKEYGLAQGFDLFQTGPRDVVQTFARARAWLARQRGPSFAFVQTYQVHAPYDPPERWRARLVRPYSGPLGRSVVDPDHPWGKRAEGEPVSEEDRRYMQDLYDAELAHTDDCVGKLLKWLEDEGRLQNTLVIVTSDHGEEFGDHGHYGHGWSLYEEMLHVPLILAGPEPWTGGRVAEHRVHGVDLAPTIARAVGLEVPREWSGIPLSSEPPSTSRPIFTTFYTRWEREPATAYLLGDDKFVAFPTRFRHSDPHPPRALFDLASDPGEELDRLSASELERKLDEERWLRAVDHAWKSYPERFRSRAAVVDTSGTRALEALGYIGGE